MKKNSEKENKRNSLARRVTSATIMFAMVIAFVGLITVVRAVFSFMKIGESYDAFSLAQTVVYLSNNLAERTGFDREGLTEQVMDIYRGLSDEERALAGTEEYRKKFVSVTDSEDYKKFYDMLQVIWTQNAVNGAYYGMYDKDTSSIVHIVDPDEREGIKYETGDPEHVADKDIQLVLDWEKNKGFPYYTHRTEEYGWVCTTGAWFKNAAGEITGLVMVEFTLFDLIFQSIFFILHYLIIVFLVTAVLSVFVRRYFKKTLAKPINDVAEAAQCYVRDRQAGVTRVDHFSNLDIATGDEIENLGKVMAQMEKDMSGYIDDLTEMTAKQERAQAEMNFAALIQRDALPSVFPAFPDRDEFDIFATMEPAKEVGGDFYDFFLTDDDHLCILIADVSDKGIPAAMFMMSALTALRYNAMMGKEPWQILTDTNATICANNSEKMFVTVWLGILEISTGKIMASNAGHEIPVLNLSGDKFEMFKRKHKFAIGGIPGLKYDQYEIDLLPGSRIFVYTDGVPEATNPDRERMGFELMVNALNEDPKASPRQLLGNVHQEVDRFVRGAEQFDDMTMLCLAYKG